MPNGNFHHIRDTTGFDTTALWARSGMMDMVKPEPDAVPARSLPGMGDHPTGLALLSAILMGLLKRERTGKGCLVSTSLVATGLWMNAFYGQAALNGAHIPPRAGRDQAPNALSNIYQCADGRWFNMALVNEDREAPGFFEAIGRSDLLEDTRFSDTPSRRRNAQDLMAILDTIFRQESWAHWHAQLSKYKITYGPVAKISDLREDQQLRHAGAVVSDQVTGLTIGSPVFVACEEKRPPQPAPEIGQHSAEILTELGYSAEEVSAMERSGIISSSAKDVA